MFRIVSAALLAVSVFAAPALAGAPGKPARTAHIQAPVIKALPGNPKVMNAYASMGRHHHHFRYHRHHRHHRHHW